MGIKTAPAIKHLDQKRAILASAAICQKKYEKLQTTLVKQKTKNVLLTEDFLFLRKTKTPRVRPTIPLMKAVRA
jgi:hypothetical protein